MGYPGMEVIWTGRNEQCGGEMIADSVRSQALLDSGVRGRGESGKFS